MKKKEKPFNGFCARTIKRTIRKYDQMVQYLRLHCKGALRKKT